MRARLLGLPAAALAAGLPALLAGLLVAPDPAHLVGPQNDSVRTHLVDDPPDLALSLDDALGGAHPVTEPGDAVAAVERTASGDRNRGVPIRVSGTALPARVLLAYRNATAALRDSDPGCHLSWSLVAGIGKVESGHAFGGAVDRKGVTVVPILGPVLDGTGDYAAIPDTDGGRWDGDTTWDRAVGPMQFIPSSWDLWGRDGDGDGVANPSDIDDAALATASYLCAGDRDLSVEKDRRRAVFSYNHSWDYVDLVLAWADAYASGSTITGSLPGDDTDPRAGGPADGGGVTVALGPPIGAVPKPTATPAGTTATAPTEVGPAAEAPASAAPTVEPAPAPTASAGDPTPADPGTPTSAAPSPDPTTAPPACPTPTDSGSPTPDPSGSPTPDGSSTPTPDPSTTPDPGGSRDPSSTPTGCPTPGQP